MSGMQVLHLRSVEQLRDGATAWDDLWWRSDVETPAVRAELLAQWIEHFEPQTDFHAIVIADGGRWVAALPLVACRVGWLLPAGGMPSNPWISCGELLLDPTTDLHRALDLMLEAAGQLPWQLLWLNESVPEAPRWQVLLRACHRNGVAACYHERFRVGRVEIDQSWDLFQKRLARSHRQGMNRSLRRLKCEGDVQFNTNSAPAEDDIEPWLRDAFEVEDRGWKGAAGTSVLRTPGMFEYFARNARQLARWGQLQLADLRLDGRMIAYVFGFRAKNVLFTQKISYDSDFSSFSPGQLLFYNILEHLHNDGMTRALDFMGPISDAQMRWRPATFGVGRVVIAPRRWIGRAAMYAYEHGWRPLRNLKTAARQVRDFAPVPADQDSDAAEPAGAMG